MGRYFLYRMHPLSVGELCRPTPSDGMHQPPEQLAESDWQALCDHGGHPEPFQKRSSRFSLRWRELRMHQLLREDVRDMTAIQDLDQLAVMARILSESSSSQLIYSSLSKHVRVSENTARRWIATLCSLHYGFVVRPWHRNISKALRKEPKWFLRDWSSIADIGKRSRACR